MPVLIFYTNHSPLARNAILSTFKLMTIFKTNKSKTLSFKATLLVSVQPAESYCDYIIVGGVMGIFEIYNRDGIEITNSTILPSPMADDIKSGNITCCAIYHSESRQDNFMLFGTNLCEICSHKLNLGIEIIHAIYFNVYAFVQISTDIIVQDLLSHKKAIIKCRDVITNVALYRNKLMVLTRGNKLIVYESSLTPDKSLHYRIVERHVDVFDSIDIPPPFAKDKPKIRGDLRMIIDKNHAYLLINALDEKSKCLILRRTCVSSADVNNRASYSGVNPEWQYHRYNFAILSAILLQSDRCLYVLGADIRIYQLSFDNDASSISVPHARSIVIPVEIYRYKNMSDFSSITGSLFINHPFNMSLACILNVRRQVGSDSKNNANCNVEGLIGNESTMIILPLDLNLRDKGKGISLCYEEKFGKKSITSFSWHQHAPTMYCYLAEREPHLKDAELDGVHVSLTVCYDNEILYQLDDLQKGCKILFFDANIIYLLSVTSSESPFSIIIPLEIVIDRLSVKKLYGECVQILEGCYNIGDLGQQDNKTPDNVELENMFYKLGSAAFIASDLRAALKCLAFSKTHRFISQSLFLEDVLSHNLCQDSADKGGSKGILEYLEARLMKPDISKPLQTKLSKQPSLVTIDSVNRISPNHDVRKIESDVSDDKKCEASANQEDLIDQGKYQEAFEYFSENKLNDKILDLGTLLITKLRETDREKEPRKLLNVALLSGNILYHSSRFQPGSNDFRRCQNYYEQLLNLCDSKEANIWDLEIREKWKIIFNRLLCLYFTSMSGCIAATRINGSKNQDTNAGNCDISVSLSAEKLNQNLLMLCDRYRNTFPGDQKLYVAYFDNLVEMELFDPIEDILKTKDIEGLTNVNLESLLGDMIDCAINQKCYRDVSYYYNVLANRVIKQNSTISVRLATCLRNSELYYVYDKIYQFSVNPFSLHTNEDVYNMCRYLFPRLAHQTKDRDYPLAPKGISVYKVAWLLLELTIKLKILSPNLMKSLNDCIHRFTPNEDTLIEYQMESTLDLMNFNLVGIDSTKEKFINHHHLGISSIDRNRLLLNLKYIISQSTNHEKIETNYKRNIFCYSCEDYTDIWIDMTDQVHQFESKCSQCRNPFIFSFLSFEILPLALIYAINEDDLKITNNDGNNNSKHAYKLQEIDKMLKSGEVFEVANDYCTLNDNNSVKNHDNFYYFKNALPDISITQCNRCYKMFYSEEWEFHIIQYRECPFCRVPIKHPP
ncbi:unnamed protein product [Gordionus sp. m RMFG-2023]